MGYFDPPSSYSLKQKNTITIIIMRDNKILKIIKLVIDHLILEGHLKIIKRSV